VELELRNLQNIYTPTEVSYDKELADWCEDEEEIYEYSVSKTFVDKKNNNKIIFTFYGALNKEDIPEDFVYDICNGIRSGSYNYLINVLNNNRNVKVEWSQIEGTTSDYTIYYDDIEADNPEVACGYKYTERKEGKWYRINC
jgi:hypothetical protein